MTAEGTVHTKEQPMVMKSQALRQMQTQVPQQGVTSHHTPLPQLSQEVLCPTGPAAALRIPASEQQSPEVLTPLKPWSHAQI